MIEGAVAHLAPVLPVLLDLGLARVSETAAAPLERMTVPTGDGG